MLRIARALLAVVLLAAWHGALLHPLQHVDEAGRLVHLQPAPGTSSGAADGLCDALAALGACVAGPLGVPVAPFSQYAVSFRSPGAARLAAAPPFLAQGPPPLL